MKLQPLLFLIILLFIKCSSNSQTQTKKLSVPDSIVLALNKGQIQVYGTHIFLIEPKDFNFNYSTNRLERNDSTYIKVVETPTASYQDKYNRFKELIKEENTRGFEIYFQKEFILQNKQAIILYGLDKAKTTEQIILLFGDKIGSTMLLSRFAANDENSKSEILKSLLSTYKSDSAALSISSIQNFKIGMLDTRFKYNSTTLQLFFYTLDGLGDPGSRTNDDVIIVGQMQPLENRELIKQKVHSMIETYKNAGINITSYKEDSVNIDKQTAFTITMNGKLNEQKVVIYGLTVGNSKSTIVFQGVAYHNHETYLDQFKRIAQTLQLK